MAKALRVLRPSDDAPLRGTLRRSHYSGGEPSAVRRQDLGADRGDERHRFGDLLVSRPARRSAMMLRALLIAAGLGQLALAAASLAIPVILGWREETARMQPLTRQIFWTYAGYIWSFH